MTRRVRLWIVSGVAMAVACIPIWGGTAAAGVDGTAVRLAMVNVPDDVVRPLLGDFAAQSGTRAEIVYTGNDPFAFAREGKADLVIAHYGHEGVEPFVTGGFGLWPHPVFANQIALLGPPGDPAHVRGLTDAAEALRRIAASRARFLVNDSDGNKYVEEMLWARAGAPAKGDWYVNRHSQGPQAARDAAKEGAYTLWGVPPFVRDSPVQVLLAHLHDAPPSLRENRPDVPRDLEAVVLRCLAKAPRDRYEDVDALDRALAGCVTSHDWTALAAEAWWKIGRGGAASVVRL